jgi:hypothetical protein
MPFTRILPPVASVLLLAALFSPTLRTVARPSGPGGDASQYAQPSGGPEVEAKCVDNSTLALKLLDEKLELVTKYGVLHVAVADVQKIEFAHRCPAEDAEKIALAISKLGHADFATRERATADLKAFRSRAYPFVAKVLQHSDPEVSKRAEEVVRFIKSKVPEEYLEPRENDTVYTADSKFTGKLAPKTLRVMTGMFGEQSIRLCDLRTVRSGSALEAEATDETTSAPATMDHYARQYGKVFSFRLTGAPGGSVWGTDVYTLDSALGTAAIHAGILKPGETKMVKVRVIQSPLQFTGSNKNGVNSAAYGVYPTGAYEFLRR